ncbi:MAG: preprotein translocase subunit YajC [Bacteroidetes bacterium]|nr:MAG: preprotein translocase subunit YajC [Bacteroidota bacterium]
MTILSIILQGGAAPAAGGGGLINILMIGLIIVVFYFFMMRPQMKKAKEQRQFIEELGKGTKVVTIGGIVAKITEVNEKTFTIETRSGTRLEVLKSAISHENSRQLNSDKSTKDDSDKSKNKKEEEETAVEETK